MNTARPPLSCSTLLRMTRPGFLAITVVACLLGLSFAAAGGARVHGIDAVATVVLACLAHAAANVLNDYHDALNGADAANRDGLFPFSGGSRLIQNGEVSPGTTRRVAWTLLGLSMAGGLWLALRSGAGLWPIGLAGLWLGWAYSAPPLQLMSRGLGELAVATVWCLVVIGANLVASGQFQAACVTLSLSYGGLIGNILLINGFPDAAADALVGKRTLAVRLGPSGAAALYALNALLAHGWLALMVWRSQLPSVTLWGLVALPFALTAAGLLWQGRQRPQTLRPAIGLTIAAAVVHGLSMATALAWTAHA